MTKSLKKINSLKPRIVFQKVADVTGSRAYERFTGNQIAKICETRQDAYDNTEVGQSFSSL